ncbi:small ribosomal subunit Rsm22 family protein [Spirochaetota bacterium]
MDAKKGNQPGLLLIDSYIKPYSAEGSRKLVDMLIKLVDETFPVPGSKKHLVKQDVLSLWRELTSERSARRAEYMGDPARLSAYLRYFMPWNVVKLASLLSAMELDIREGSSIMDIGSGPLSLPIALWIAKAEYRTLPLKLVCTDRVPKAMESGQRLLEAMALRNNQPLAWQIELKKDDFLYQTAKNEEKFDLVTAANVFNESFWRQKGSISERASQLAANLGKKLKTDGSALLIEPGDPRGGSMLAALREAVILGGGSIMAPCPHGQACPMPGNFLSGVYRKTDEEAFAKSGKALIKMDRVVMAKGRSKAPWCHFSVDMSAAPKSLLDFSDKIGLPKDRLIASWLFFKPHSKAAINEEENRSVRLISDAFKLPDGGFGRYACSKAGYTMARGSLAELPSGTLAILDKDIPGLKAPKPGQAPIQKDAKSGAIILRAFFSKV